MAEHTPRPVFSLAARARRAVEQPISYLMHQAVANPRLISLAAGLVDYETLPTDEVRTLLDELLSDPKRGALALQYGTTEGLADLRTLLYEHLAALDGMNADSYPGSVEDVVVTTGSQQLLHILTDVLVDPDDVVITAWPSYFVYTGALTGMAARLRTVEMDEHGLVPEKLDDLLAAFDHLGQLQRVKIVYVQSYHQNPTGLTLAGARRAELLDVVRRHSRKHRILLIEDAAYRELTYDPPRTDANVPVLPSIKQHDKDNAHVALLQTFSKPFSPGLKTGYGLLPRDLVEPVRLAKGGRDFGSTNLCQHLLYEALRQGVYHRHVAKLCEAYAGKRDAMLAALQQHFGDRDDVHWTRPAGGLYVWLTLPEAVDTSRHGPLFEHAIREGVLFVPGEYCYPADPSRAPAAGHTMRLSFGVPTIEQIEHGIARLARAVQHTLDAAASRSD